MRSVVRWCVAAAVIGVAFPRGSALAQDRAELERRVDEAVARRNVAAADLARFRTVVARHNVYPDTVLLLGGTSRILSEHDHLPMVRDAALQVDSLVSQWTRAHRADLAGPLAAVWSDSARRAEGGVNVALFDHGREVTDHPAIADSRSIARAIEAHVVWLVGTNGKPVFDKWFTGGLPLDTATNTDWRSIRLELVSSGIIIGRRCYTGDLGACRAVLGLASDRDPITAWYDSSDRRAAVRAISEQFPRDVAHAKLCLSGHDADCIAVMRSRDVFLIPPGSALARTALLQQAIALGGVGLLDRLAASRDSAPDVVSAVANAPLDSVVARWQRHAHDGGIESESATPVVAMTALGWVLVMGAISLRSSRWR